MANMLPNQVVMPRRSNMRTIDNRRHLLNTFTNRRATVFNKITQLATLMDTEVALIVYGPDGRLYHYGSPSIDAVMERYRNAGDGNHCVETLGGMDLNQPPPPPPPPPPPSPSFETIIEPKSTCKSGPYWWGANIDGMDLHELKVYITTLQDMWKDAVVQLREVEKGFANRRGKFGAAIVEGGGF